MDLALQAHLSLHREVDEEAEVKEALPVEQFGVAHYETVSI